MNPNGKKSAATLPLVRCAINVVTLRFLSKKASQGQWQ
jgi:hypothetical protein